MALLFPVTPWCPRRRPLMLAGVAWLASALAPAGAIAQDAVPTAPAQAPTWTLERVVTAALDRHPLIEAGVARVDAARSQRDAVRALPNPTVSVLLENSGFPGQAPIPGLDREVSTAVSWPVEQLFQRAPRIQVAEQDLRAAEASSGLTRRQVVDGVARVFFRVALAEALADEARENRDRLDQLATYNRARVAEGVTAEGELLRVEIELDQAATAIVLADVELTRSRAELRPYLESDPAAGDLTNIRVSVVEGAADRTSLPVLATLLDRARNGHPEIVAGRAQVAAADASAAYERRVRFGDVGATFGSKQFEGRTSMIAGLTLNIPVFNANRSNIARAAYERAAAQAEVSWTERLIAAEVEGAHRAATQLTAQLGALEESFIARAEEVQRLTLGAYQEGGATLLQVLDATRTLVDARMTYFRVLVAQRLGLLELGLATGAEPTDVLRLFRVWSASGSTDTPTGGQ